VRLRGEKRSNAVSETPQNWGEQSRSQTKRQACSANRAPTLFLSSRRVEYGNKARPLRLPVRVP
jgi:hypothetical protein